MYAIVDIAGQQFKVEKDQKIFVHRLASEVGEQVDFDKVLLIDNEKSVVVGGPVIEGALITAKVLEHLKGDKVIVFKKKRRKGYKVKNGHRQLFTQLLIEEIVETGGKARPVVKEKKAKQTVVEKPEVEVTVTEISAEAAEVKSDVSISEAVKKKAVTGEAAEVKPEVNKAEAVKEKPVTGEVAVEKPTVKKPAAKETKAKKATETAAEKKAELKPKAKAAPKKAAAKSTAAKKDDKPAAAKKTKKATDKDE